LIQVTSTPATAAILRETRKIPVVFGIVTDPVGSGFVPNLFRPGGNVTGFSNFDPPLVGKWAQLLKEIVSRLSRFALLFNPDTAPFVTRYSEALESATRQLGIATQLAPFHGAADIEATITGLARRPETGLIVMPDISNQRHRKTIISLAALHRVVAVYPFRFFAKDGGLASYGVDLLDQQRGAATYADRILKGAKPGDLPVQLPTRFELIINLKTAKALGLTIPPSLLGRADEVIQ
jgi:putative ABC transport system substrate-binding protein